MSNTKLYRQRTPERKGSNKSMESRSTRDLKHYFTQVREDIVSTKYYVEVLARNGDKYLIEEDCPDLKNQSNNRKQAQNQIETLGYHFEELEEHVALANSVIQQKSGVLREAKGPKIRCPFLLAIRMTHTFAIKFTRFARRILVPILGVFILVAAVLEALSLAASLTWDYRLLKDYLDKAFSGRLAAVTECICDFQAYQQSIHGLEPMYKFVHPIPPVPADPDWWDILMDKLCYINDVTIFIVEVAFVWSPVIVMLGYLLIM